MIVSDERGASVVAEIEDLEFRLRMWIVQLEKSLDDRMCDLENRLQNLETSQFIFEAKQRNSTLMQICRSTLS